MKGAKGVKIPVIYDKNRLYNKTMIDEGIKLYERLNKIRFKEIIVVSANGNVHRHKHND